MPWSNNVGAISGAIAGAIMSGWISFGTQAAIAAGAIHSHRLNMSVEGCEVSYRNVSTVLQFNHDESDVFPLYRLSFMWINPSECLYANAQGPAIVGSSDTLPTSLCLCCISCMCDWDKFVPFDEQSCGAIASVNYSRPSKILK